MLRSGIQHESVFALTLVAAVRVDAAPVVARVRLLCNSAQIVSSSGQLTSLF